MAKRDYYEVLGVSKNATEDEIKRNYRKIALQNHPDRQNGKSDKEKKEAEEKFKEATEAYEVLSDKDKRAKYDQFGFAGVGDQSNADYSNVFHDFGDIFGDFFGGESPFSSFFGGHTRQTSSSSENNNKNIRIQIDLEQALFGCSADIKVNRSRICKKCNGTGSADGKSHACSMCNGTGMKTQGNGFFRMSSTCPQCHGTGKSYSTPCSECNGQGYSIEHKVVTIKIPEGSVNGKNIVIPKMGDEGKNGFGNLNISLLISESSKYKYSNGKVYCRVKIPLGNAMMGKDIDIWVHNKKHKLSVPRGCSNGKELLLTTIKGIQLICVVDVDIPITYAKTIKLDEFTKVDTGLEDF